MDGITSETASSPSVYATQRCLRHSRQQLSCAHGSFPTPMGLQPESELQTSQRSSCFQSGAHKSHPLTTEGTPLGIPPPARVPVQGPLPIFPLLCPHGTALRRATAPLIHNPGKALAAPTPQGPKTLPALLPSTLLCYCRVPNSVPTLQHSPAPALADAYASIIVGLLRSVGLTLQNYY